MKNIVQTNKISKSLFSLLLMLFLGLFLNNALAQQRNMIWTGATNSDWSTASNWNYPSIIAAPATFVITSTTVTLPAAASADIAVGDTISGNGIAGGTTILAIDVLRTTLTISANTTAASSGTYTFTFATVKNAVPGIATDVVNITNGGTPNIASGTVGIARIVISNATGPVSGSTLTVSNGATLNFAANASNLVSLNGGNIINNGTITITSTGVGFAGFPATGINFGNPSVFPATPTEYGYSGSGTLSISLSSANFAGAAAIASTGITANANVANVTYKAVLNNPTITYNQATALTIGAIRTTTTTAALPLAPKLLISGTGFTIGSVGSPYIGSLVALGAGTTITIDTSTSLTFNSISTNTNSIINSFSGLPSTVNFTNKGTITIQGASTAAGLNFAGGNVLNASIFNVQNEGTLNVNLNIGTATVGAYNISDGGGIANAGSVVNLTNTATGILTFRNTSVVSNAGDAMFTTTAGSRIKTIFINNGIVNLEGTRNSRGQSSMTITNNATVNSNAGFDGFTAINNNVAGAINFSKGSVSLTVLLAAAATVGATYTDGNNNLYTVITTKVGGSGTTLDALYNPVAAITAAGTLTKQSGTGDASIAYSAIAVSAILTSITNNLGTINTTSSPIAQAITGVTAASSGIIAPGGSGFGIANLNIGAITPNGVLNLQITGTTAGVNYDQLTNSVAGTLTLGSLDLNITSLYNPGTNTTIPIITASAISGTLASVTGLTSDWAISYTATAVNLVFTETTFTWTGVVSTDWTNPSNWTKSGPSLETFPGEFNASSLVIINTNSAAFAPIIASGNYKIARLTITNSFGSTAGATLTINVGATLNVQSTSVTNVVLNGGNIINNGTLNVSTTATGVTGFPVYGISCGDPVQLPGVATEYGYSGLGTLTINLANANLAGSSAIYVAGTTSVNPTYKFSMNSNATISLNASSTASINVFRSNGGATANKLKVGGVGFTVGSLASPSIGSLFSFPGGADLIVEAGTTLTFYSKSTNTQSIITSFSSIATATNFTNLGEIYVIGSSTRSGLSFSSGSSAIASVFNISNQGTLSVDLTITDVGSAPFTIGNGGGGNANAGTVVNLNNTATGVLTLKNNSTALGTGQAIFCTVTGEAAPLVINNSGTLNLEGAVNTFANKTTLNNTGFITTNNELRHFTAINNNAAGEISFFKNASTAVTRQVQFNGLTLASASNVGTTYTYGGNTFVVITQKYTTFGTTLTANVLSSASVVSAAGSLILSSGTGDASIAFTSISIVATNNAIVGTCTNSGTIYTASGTDLNIISGVSDASTGAIVPGSSLFGIANLNKASTTPDGILRIQVAGTTAGVDYDQMVNTAGSINVGSLDLNLVSLYEPAASTTISIITATAIAGTLASTTGLNQVPVGWAVAYTATSVDLVYTPPTFTTTTWNGSVDTDWTLLANWTGGLPTNLTNVVIAVAANQPLIAASTVSHIKSLTLNSSTTLTVNAGATLTVTDAITNNGTLTFENNANLVQINNAVNTGSIIYKRTTPNLLDTDYTYWSSPVVGQTLSAISPINYDAGRYYTFDTVLNDWSIWLPHTTVMLPSVGYIMRGKNIPGPNIEATFTGIPNNGVQTTPTGAAGNNCLLGNPYPSAIDADAFLGANIATIEGTLYFWTHNTPITNSVYTSSDYASYNGTGGVSATSGGVAPTGKIAAAQGFFATSKEASTVTFNNFMRFDGSGTPFNNTNFYKTKNGNKSNAVEKHRVWLNLTNTQGAFKQMLVGYVTNATNGYDSAFDGRSFNGNEFVDFYSVLNTRRYTIQGRALPFDENDEVPLGYRSKIDGEFSINFDNADGLLTNQAVFLEDKLSNTIVNLKTGKYTFTTGIGVFNDRFVLRFVDNTLSINNLEGKSNQVYVSVKNKQLKVNAVGDGIEKLTVFDLLGRVLYTRNNVNSAELTAANFVAATQTVVVKIVLQNGKIVTKKVLF